VFARVKTREYFCGEARRRPAVDFGEVGVVIGRPLVVARGEVFVAVGFHGPVNALQAIIG
jgi:hypothetical protein